MSKIKVELVTPEELVFSGEADSVEVPGAEGDFGVLYNHAPMISTIRPGIVSVHNNNALKEIFISGGFAEITGERCTILAERSIDVAGFSAEQRAKLISEAATSDKAAS
jgi:F-type H+-transporting ATPase subunit epsilon